MKTEKLKNPKVVIIEDHDFDKEGIKGTVSYNFKVIDTFVSSQNFFAKYRELEKDTDIILIDYQLQKAGSLLNGDQIIRRLVKENYQAKFVIISGVEDVVGVVQKAKAAGASGFSQKALNVNRYKRFIDTVYNTSEFIIEQGTKDTVIEKMFMILETENKPQSLDLQQIHIDIIKMMMYGRNNDEIIHSLLRKEFNDKLIAYYEFDKRYNFQTHIKSVEKEIAETKHIKRKENLEKLKKFLINTDNETIDVSEKMHKLKEYPYGNLSKEIKTNITFFKKQIDNHLHGYKLKIKSELQLPNTQRDTLIYGMILHNLINNEDIKQVIENN